MSCEAEATVDELTYKIFAENYADKTAIAVENLISHPSTSVGEKYHQWHQKLYDLLYDHIIDVGTKYNGGVFVIDPNEIMNAFNTYLSIRRGGLSIGAIFVGTNSMQAIYNIAKEGIALKNKRIHSTTKTLMPEDYISFRIDETGTVSKITESASTLSDRFKQMSLPFKHKFLQINRGLYNWMEELNRGGHVDLNDLLINPINIRIRGEKQSKFRFRDPSRNVKLVEVVYNKSKPNLIDGYIIEENGIRKTITENDFDLDKDKTIGKQIIEKSVGGIKEFIDDLGHGEIRRVKPMVSKKINKSDRDKVAWMLKASGKKGELGQRSPYIHSKLVGDISYNYVLIKQGENDIGETYNLYIVNHKDVTTDETVYYFDSDRGYTPDIKSLDEQADPTILTELIINEQGKKESISAFPAGFYKASEQELFGQKLNKRFKPIKGSTDKEFTGFEYMKKQPNSKLVDEDIAMEEGNFSIWTALHEKRVKFNELWETAQQMSISTNKIVEEWFEKAHKKTIKQLMDENNTDFVQTEIEAVDKIFGDLKKLGIENRLWYNDANNELHSLALSMTKKQENYFPVKFTKEISDGFIDNAISEIDSKIELATSISEAEELQKVRDNYETTREVNFGNRTILEKLAIFFKHRKPFTDDTMRRKDDEVETEYIDTVFSALLKNKLLSDTMIGLHNISSLHKNKSVPMEQIKYMVNSVKSAMNDPSIEAEMFGIDVSPATIAKYMNVFSSEEKWTPEDAERVFKRIKAWMTAMLLGSNPAFTNRFQKYNEAIIGGKAIIDEAHRLANGKEADKWDYIVDYGGGMNMIAALNDAVMTSTSDLQWNDALFYNNPLAGIVPFLPRQIPNPANLKDYISMFYMKRDKFIEKGHHAADRVIDHMIEKRIQKSRSLKEKTDLEYLKKLKKQVRAAYFDLVTTPEEENTRKVIKQRYKNLVGEVTSTMEKKFVSWKLSWWFNSDFKDLDKAFTFMGAEGTNRKEAYIAGLLMADAFGDLGSDTKKDSVTGIENRFLTKKAVLVGRLSIESTQFNMAQVNQGEGFRGAGQVFLQYRDYTVKQMRFSRNIRKAWLAGSDSKSDQITRLEKAILDVAKPSVRNELGTEIDYEALAMARLIYTRVAATVLASTIASLPGFNYTIKRATGEAPLTAMRGFESPIFAIFGRILGRWLVWALIGDDDDKKIRNKTVKTAEDIMRLLIPVTPAIIIGYFMRAGVDLIDTFED
ncbi:MAG: hypothetical protein H8E98_02010 [Bacteroidetes bacterium]|nr:hypothetical protein [Bacteroidota bacterium]